MTNMGVVEGFFGPQWTIEDRLSYADFLSRYGGSFYIYAPKQDFKLRKAWRDPWDAEYLKLLTTLAKSFQAVGVSFGIGFSPFGLGPSLTLEDKEHLNEKLEKMNEIGIDLLGLFFDDMPTNDNLAETQIAVLKFVQKKIKQQIIFCPSYYTFDPILDKVFGPRPENYLEKVAEGIPLDVSIAWTGPKVISPVIDQEHVKVVEVLLKRRPFIWENLFANDGPKNCKFLKLKYFSGRDKNIFSHVEAFGLNLMNQAQLSKVLFLSSKYVAEGGECESSFENALTELASPELKDFISKNRELFLSVGLDQISKTQKESFILELNPMSDLMAKEVIDWLNDKYLVGSECLTD